MISKVQNNMSFNGNFLLKVTPQAKALFNKTLQEEAINRGSGVLRHETLRYLSQLETDVLTKLPKNDTLIKEYRLTKDGYTKGDEFVNAVLGLFGYKPKFIVTGERLTSITHYIPGKKSKALGMRESFSFLNPKEITTKIKELQEKTAEQISSFVNKI